MARSSHRAPVRGSASDPAAGALDQNTIDLVQQSWAKVRPISDAAATLFYDRLFELDPSVRPLFKNDMGEQKKKLMQTLGVAVDGLRAPAKLVPVLEDLGVRHAGYMVQPHHYDRVGEALLWTLGEGLGDAFTSEVRAAWTEVYGFVATVMKRAAARQGGGVDVTLRDASGRHQAARTPPAPPRAPAAPRAQAAPPPAPSASNGAGAQYGGLPDARTIALVQNSWAKVRPISDAAATLFYDRLFELDPSVRPLFKNDMGEQKKKLMQTLNVAVEGLRAPAKLVPILEDLGARHAGYMVKDHHYDRVGEALLWTLGEGLGDDFTGEVEAAWTQVYDLVATVMKRGAASHESAEGPTDRFLRPRAAGTPAAGAAASAPAMPAVAPASAAGQPAPAVAASAGVEIPRGLFIPVGVDDSTVDIRVTLVPPPGAAPAPRRGGLAVAFLLALTCGAAVLTGTSVLLFSLVDMAGIAARVPTAALYILPLGAAVLAVASFLLGYLWSSHHARTDRSSDSS